MTLTYKVGDTIGFTIGSLPATGIICRIISLDTIIVESGHGKHVFSADELAGDEPTVFIKEDGDG